MRVAIRVDASVSIGTGHLARCLTLAQCLSRRGHEVTLVSRDLPGSGLDAVAPPVSVQRLPVAWPQGVVEALMSDEVQAADVDATRTAAGGEVDWVVVDSYGLSDEWERRARDFATGVFVVDDLANRVHDCDVLLDQNRLPGSATAYAGLVPARCDLLVGPAWALLRPEFDAALSRAHVRREVSRILVFLGGADEGDRTSFVLRALALLGQTRDLEVDVVLGPANPHRDAVEELAARVPRATVSVGVTDMAERILDADLAIGAAGTATWERVHLGLPAVLLVVAENQREIAAVVEQAGAGWTLPESASETDLRDFVAELIADPRRVAEASRHAFDLAGGAGSAADRVAEKLETRWVVGRPHARLRRLRPEDRELLLAWRNSERVRSKMADRHVIGETEHAAWFASHLGADPASHLVFESDGAPAGLASLSGFSEDGSSCEWGFYLGEQGLPPRSGSRMCWLLLEYAFNTRTCTEVRARVRRDNARSLALHARFGFEPDHAADTGELEAFVVSAEQWVRVRDDIATAIFGAVNANGSASSASADASADRETGENRG